MLVNRIQVERPEPTNRNLAKALALLLAEAKLQRVAIPQLTGLLEPVVRLCDHSPRAPRRRKLVFSWFPTDWCGWVANLRKAGRFVPTIDDL